MFAAPFGSVNETMLVRAAEGLQASGLAAKGCKFTHATAREFVGPF